MATIQTQSQLLAELQAVAQPASVAKQTLERAAISAGVRGQEEITEQQLLQICQALASEGGTIQQFAEALASNTMQAQSDTKTDAA